MKKAGIVKSSIFVMVLIILGKVLALVRDALIAEQFGATAVTDIYNFALGVVYLLTTISYGITTTFIPVHTECREKNGERNALGFVSNVINVTTAATLLLTLLLIAFSGTIIDIFAPGFGSDTGVYSSSVLILRIMLASLVFINLQSVITGVLQVHKQFFEPSAMAAAANVVYILYLVFLARDYGIIGFGYATVAAFLVQLLINVPKYFKLGYGYRPVFNPKDEHLRTILQLMPPVVISTSLIQLNMFVNRSFATTVYSGAVTVLEFSNKINTLAYEVFAIGIAMIIYPTLSEHAARGKTGEYKAALVKGINTILLIMVPAAFAIAMLRMPLITVIFKRGAFDQASALATANALLFFCPAMIAYGVRDILNKAFYSMKDTRTPMFNSFAGIILNIILNFLLVKKMGVSGLTLATTLSSLVTTLLMLGSINRKLGGMRAASTLETFGKVLLSSTAMALAIYAVDRFCAAAFGAELLGSVLSLLISFAVGTAVYAAGLHLMKIEEFQWLAGALRKKLRKGEKPDEIL
ncbi:MAG: integral rane protein MviN [Firmicutes bacterium]|nr:integral rane protein MviN [Bacillota bacterium]